MRSWLHTFDSYFIRAFQRYRGLYWPMKIITQLGHPIVVIAIGIGVMWIGWPANLRMVCAGVIILATLGFGSWLKLVLHRQRPLTDYAARMRVKSHSFPSGHSVGGAVAYGTLGYLAVLHVVQPLASLLVASLIVLTLLIGISRVYLGAHYPSDVVAGWILGVLGVWMIITYVMPFA